MMRARIAILVAGGLFGPLAVTPPRVDAALCRTRHGALVVRGACRRKEVPLDLAAVGVGGPKGDPGPKGGSHHRLRAFDASGKPLPGYLSARGDVIVPQGSRAVRVRATLDGFEAGGQFFFDAMNCTGQRLVDEGPLVHQTTVVGTTAYYAGDPVELHAFQSSLFSLTAAECNGPGDTYDPAIGFCCRNYTGAVRAGPAAAVDLGAFTPPFRLEIER
jgi:hypothetical protein